VELAERGDHQPDGEKRVGHEAIAEVEPSEQPRRGDEQAEDHDLEQPDGGRHRRQRERAAARGEVGRAGDRRQGGLPAEQHERRGQQRQRRPERDDQRCHWRSVAPQAPRRAEDEQGRGSEPRHGPEVDRRLAGRLGRQAEFRLVAADDEPDHQRIGQRQRHERGALVERDGLPGLAPAHPGKDRDRRAYEDGRYVDRDVERAGIGHAGEARHQPKHEADGEQPDHEHAEAQIEAASEARKAAGGVHRGHATRSPEPSRALRHRESIGRPGL
jgi:hypothetical protein